MSQNAEEKREVIVTEPNRKLFPNALPHTNEPMDTTRIPNRVLGPIQTNDMVRDIVEAGAKKRAENEIFIDRREPVTLRRTHESIRNGEGVLRGQANSVAAKLTEVTKTIDTLKKLSHQWAKQKANPFAEGAKKQIEERLLAAEELLTSLKNRERRIAVDIKQNAKSLKEFLVSRPRPEFPTNGELLAMFSEAEALERELHQIDHLASSKAGMLI
jgi:hypothetical protein